MDEEFDISNTVLIDGKAVKPGVYTCVWAGNQEWRVIITESDDIPDENAPAMESFLRELAVAVESVLGRAQ